MAAIAELETPESDISTTPWQELSAEYAVASDGVFDEFFYKDVVHRAWILTPEDLRRSTVYQAVLYAKKVDIEPDLRIIQYYGYLREGFFAWPVANRDRALRLNALCDQRMFAITLLLGENRDAYANHISQYPNIFD